VLSSSSKSLPLNPNLELLLVSLSLDVWALGALGADSRSTDSFGDWIWRQEFAVEQQKSSPNTSQVLHQNNDIESNRGWAKKIAIQSLTLRLGSVSHPSKFTGD
jgi:hypothetical protein